MTPTPKCEAERVPVKADDTKAQASVAILGDAHDLEHPSGAEKAALLRLETLIGMAEEVGLVSLARHWRDGRCRDILKQRVHIVCLGEFNHGKSSLLNSLIGVNALDVGIVPTTQVESLIFSAAEGQEAGVELVHHSGETEHIDWETWLKGKLKTSKELEKFVIKLPQMAYDPATVFVDTPGLNEASLKREAFLKHTLGRADLVLFVLDGSQALTRTELDIIATRIVPLGAERIAFVVNKCDRLDDDEWLEVCAHVETALFEDLGSVELFMLSSKDATLGDMDRLKARIAELVERSKSSRVEAAALRAIDELSMILSGLLQVMRTLSGHDKTWLKAFYKKAKTHEGSAPALAALADGIDAFDRQSQGLNAWVQAEITRFAKDFSRRIPREIDKASIDDIEDYLAAFIADTTQAFLQDLAQHCTEQMSGYIAAAFGRIMPKDGTDAAEHSSLSAQIILRETRRFMAQQLSAASIVNFDMMPASLLGKVPIIAGVIQSRSESTLKKRVKGQAIERIETLSREASQCLTKDISRQAENFSTIFRETGGQFYRHLSDMAKQLMTAAANGRDSLEDIDLIEASIYWSSAEPSAH